MYPWEPFESFLLPRGIKESLLLSVFFEVLIWITAIGRVMQNLDNWICYVAFAGGFAAGNYTGMIIDERLALGYELVRVITKAKAGGLVRALRNEGYGTTQVQAYSSEGEVAIVYIIINRKKLKSVVEMIRKFNPRASYTIEDIRHVSKDIVYRRSKDYKTDQKRK